MKFTVQWNALEKRQLLIFALVAFGVPYLMGIAMGAGFYAGSDVSVFPNAQMFYPAAGVMLALFVTKKEDNMLPRKFFVCFLALTVLMLACSLASVLAPALPWALISNLVMMGGTLAAWVCYFADGKARRAVYGLRLTKTGGTNSFVMLLLFIVLYFARIFLLSGMMMLADPAMAQAGGKPAGNAPKLCFGLYCFLWGRIWLARFFAAPAAKTVRPAGRHSGAGRCVGPVAFAHQYLLLQPGHLGAQRAQPGVPVHLLQRFLRVCLCQDKEHLGAGDDSLFQEQRGAVVRQCQFH